MQQTSQSRVLAWQHSDVDSKYQVGQSNQQPMTACKNTSLARPSFPIRQYGHARVDTGVPHGELA